MILLCAGYMRYNVPYSKQTKRYSVKAILERREALAGLSRLAQIQGDSQYTEVNLTDSCENIRSTSSNSLQRTHSRSVACGIHCAQENNNACISRTAGRWRALVLLDIAVIGLENGGTAITII